MRRYDVNPGMSFKDHFSSKSKDYAQYRPTYPPELTAYLASLSAAYDAAWDCGCGNGQLSVPLAKRYAEIMATDASAEQLESAMPHPHVTYTCAKAEASGLAAHTADLVASAQAAHWFDLDGFYREVRRVAKPGAPLALVSYGNAHLDAELDAFFQNFYGTTLGAYWPPERRHIENGYRDFPFPFREITTPAFTFEAAWPFARFRGYVDTWSAIRALEKAGMRSIADAFFAELEKRWGPQGSTRRIRWPLSIRAGYL